MTTLEAAVLSDLKASVMSTTRTPGQRGPFACCLEIVRLFPVPVPMDAQAVCGECGMLLYRHAGAWTTDPIPASEEELFGDRDRRKRARAAWDALPKFLRLLWRLAPPFKLTKEAKVPELPEHADARE